MHLVKRFESFAAIALAVFVVTLLLAPSVSFADESDDKELLSSMMETRGMGGLVGFDLLFDEHGEATYVIGYSDDGYLIANRGTGAFMEQGGGDPYARAEGKKCYGGLLCYSEEVDDCFVNLITGEKSEDMPACPSSAAHGVGRGAGNSDGSQRGTMRSASIVWEEQLSERMPKVKGVAFGLNSLDGDGAINNSCTAVALTIALNYLDHTHDDRLVNSAMELEDRIDEDFQYDWYTHAIAFHHHLVNDCGLGPLLGSFGMWGPFVGGGVQAYLDEDDDRSEVGLDFDWTIINTGWIEGSIDKDTPALITIALTSWENGQYNNHTMVVYGYRRMSDGTTEINLHSGWYGSTATEDEDTGIWYMDDIWAPGGVPDITYSFYLSDGWHHSGSGDWKYYEDELPVTGWKTISGNTYHFDSNGVRTTGNYIENGILYVFDNNGVLVSQSPISSPFTGPSDDVRISGLQVAYQKWLQSTGPDAIPAALERAMQANPDVFGWLYVPGTDLSLPLAMDGPGGSYYLDHGAGAEPNGFGCAFGRGGSRDLSDAVTVLYGHSFADVGLAFTSLHSFEGYSFFAGHDEAYVYLPGRRLEYRIVAANLFNSRAIEDVDQSDAADLADYFAELSNPDPAAFTGFKRAFSLDPASDRVLQLSTCTMPADPAHRYVVTCVYVGEEAV